MRWPNGRTERSAPVARVVPRLERVEGVVARVLDQVDVQLVDLLPDRAGAT